MIPNALQPCLQSHGLANHHQDRLPSSPPCSRSVLSGQNSIQHNLALSVGCGMTRSKTMSRRLLRYPYRAGWSKWHALSSTPPAFQSLSVGIVMRSLIRYTMRTLLGFVSEPFHCDTTLTERNFNRDCFGFKVGAQSSTRRVARR